MKHHVLAYVQRSVITHWKKIVLTGDKIQFLYGSSDDHLFAKLKDGCILWLVASFPDKPPELVAKLDVEMVRCIDCPDLHIEESILHHFRKREFKWIAKATDNSMFFGHNDAGSALVKTVFERPSGECWSLSQFSPVWLPEFGKRFLRPRLIHLDSAALNYTGGKIALHPFEELAAKASSSVFMSWKWDDNDEQEVIKLADLLVQRGFMVWLDKLALPTSKALEKVQQDEDKLGKLLAYGYQQCKYLLALNTEHYGVKSEKSAQNWTRREYEGALEQGKRAICFAGKNAPSPVITCEKDYTIAAAAPEIMVRRFADIIEQISVV